MTNMRSLYFSGNQISSIEPIANLKKIWALDASKNPIADFKAIANLKGLNSLDLHETNLKDLSAIRSLQELTSLYLMDNPLEDISALSEMCAEDAASSKRFAPFIKVYLKGTPVAKDAKNEQIAKLKELKVRLILESGDSKP